MKQPPLTLLEAQTLACLSLGTRLPFAHVSRTSSQTLQRLQRKGFIALSTSLERSMTPEGALALRSTWEWLLLSARQAETFYERTDRLTREKYDGPDKGRK